MSSYRLECALSSKAELGEHPIWSADDDCLYWLDIQNSTINRFAPATGKNMVWTLASPPGGASRFTPDGRWHRYVDVPVRFVTMVAFGGSDLSTLNITTARLSACRRKASRRSRQPVRHGNRVPRRPGDQGPTTTIDDGGQT